MSLSFGKKVREFKNYLAQQVFENDPGQILSGGAEPVTKAQWSQLYANRRFSDVLPYESYEESKQFFYNDDSFGFMLEVTPVSGLSEDNIRVLAGSLGSSVPANTDIQFIMYASPDVYPQLNRWYEDRASAKARERRVAGVGGDEHDVFEELARRRVSYLAAGATKSFFSDQVQVIRDFRSLVCVQLPLPEGDEPSEADIEELDRLRSGLIGTFRSIGMGAHIADAAHLINVMDTILNPRKVRDHTLRWQDDLGLSEQMVEPDTTVHIGSQHLIITNGDEQRDVRCYTVREYPPEWAGWMGTNLIGDLMNNNRRLSCPFLTTCTLHIPDQISASGAAKTKAMRATQMAESDIAKHIPNWRDKRDEWQFVVQKMDQGHVFTKLNYQVILFAPMGEGNRCEQELFGVYKGSGWTLGKERNVTGPAFLSALPLCAGPRMVKESATLLRWRSLMSWTAANVAPLIGEWKGNYGGPKFDVDGKQLNLSAGLLQLIGRRGQIIDVDPWENEAGNYNFAVVAAPGAGKSVFAQELITNLLAVGGRTWIFDRGRSYERVCHLLGGQFIEFEAQTNICLNPFTHIKNWSGVVDADLPLTKEERADAERAGAEGVMLKYVVAQMVSPDKPLESLQMSWIENALNNVWSQYKRDGDINKVAAELLKSDDQRQQDLGDSLGPYTDKGFFGRYFNGKANLTLDHDFVVLETQELDAQPDLQAVVVLMLMLKVTQAMYLGERSRRKLCLIDEAWKLMGKGNTGEFIEEGTRTARKFGGSFGTIAHRIEDYDKSPAAKAALATSDFTFLLRQRPDSIRQLVESKRLPSGDESAELITSITTAAGMYSEVAVVSPQGLGLGRLILDPFSEKLYTSKGPEYDAIQEMVAGGMTLSQAISKLAEGSRR